MKLFAGFSAGSFLLCWRFDFDDIRMFFVCDIGDNSCEVFAVIVRSRNDGVERNSSLQSE